MKWIASYALAAAALSGCGAGDNETVEGANANCAFGGALNDCPDAEHTSEGACWRLVDCGAIVVDGPDNTFDWGRCVDGIDGLTEDRRRIVIACVAAATCDELRVDGFCFEFGR